MPGGDGSGPLGRGAMTGRRLGYCSGYPVGFGSGRRLGLGRGYRRGFRRYAQPVEPRSDRELLMEEREMLESRLNIVNRELKDLSEDDE